MEAPRGRNGADEVPSLDGARKETRSRAAPSVQENGLAPGMIDRPTDAGRALPRFDGSTLRHYSRFVSRAKLILPIIAAILLMLLAMWPYISVGLPQIERELRSLEPKVLRDSRMLRPHYSGIDKEDRPYTLTAESARQSVAAGSVPAPATGDDGTASPDSLVALEAPKASLLTKEGRTLTATGTTGLYQSQTHFLDLFGSVTLVDSKGFVFNTHTARINLANGVAEGNEAVAGQGPSGTVEAQGFRAVDRGDVIYFRGRSHLILQGAREVSK